jgi:hypothetical protein
MGAELLRCPLESLVGEVPLEVDEAPGDLAQKADHQESKELVFGPSGTGDPEHRLSSHGLRYGNASRCTPECKSPVHERARAVDSSGEAGRDSGCPFGVCCQCIRASRLSGASVEEITESAGYSRGAFYSNFDSKEELFLTLIESRTEDNLRDIAVAFRKGDTPEERIRSGGAFVDSMAGRDRQWCVLHMEFWARAVRDPKLRRRFSKQYEVWRDGIALMIEAQNEEPGLELDVPPRELASGLIALCEGRSCSV